MLPVSYLFSSSALKLVMKSVQLEAAVCSNFRFNFVQLVLTIVRKREAAIIAFNVAFSMIYGNTSRKSCNFCSGVFRRLKKTAKSDC